VLVLIYMSLLIGMEVAMDFLVLLMMMCCMGLSVLGVRLCCLGCEYLISWFVLDFEMLMACYL
jgi:hypothetical protein